ncbi:MAG TPA: FecR domain-containing protein [Roseimicrobium sp.]|nr:FecR domain-containing protein [Roseimicrobium sp.]
MKDDQQQPDDRIERAIEQRLSPEEWAALQAEIVADPKLRREYVERQWLHATLRAEGDVLGRTLLDEPIPMDGNARRWPLVIAGGVIAANLMLLFSLFLRSASDDAKHVATLIKAQNCKWAASDLPTKEQSKLSAGTLALVEGMATLRFESGATVTLEAPTTIQLIDKMHCRLLEGSAVAEVPEPAHGFTIDTADLKAVDLGTRFGITAGSSGNSQVYVFEGEVNVHDLKGTELKHLTKGKVYTVDTGSTNVFQEPMRSEQIQKPDGWYSISTAFGRGKDGFVRRGNRSVSGSQPLIMVKHTDLAAGKNNERRAYLTFDVSHIGPMNAPEAVLLRSSGVQQAQLVLDPRPSGLGFAALVPDSRFSVYGVTDESLDSWAEGGLQWETAPAATDAGLIDRQVRKLAEFSIPRGGAADLITVGSADLAQFIREDTNGLATFIIVRETGETDQQGLVHAFASKEHPYGKPPTLRMK